MNKKTYTAKQYNLLWYGYIILLIMLIMSLYQLAKVSGDTYETCKEIYAPLLEQIEADPLINYNLSYTYKELFPNGSLSKENYAKEEIKWNN